MDLDRYFGPPVPAVSPARRRRQRALNSAELSRDEAELGQLWNLEAGQPARRKGVTMQQNARAWIAAERNSA